MRQFAGSKPVYVGLRAGYPDTDSGDSLIEKVRAARRAGAAGFAFYCYGIFEKYRMKWIRAALGGESAVPN